jgi:general secretion pathway protein D
MKLAMLIVAFCLFMPLAGNAQEASTPLASTSEGAISLSQLVTSLAQRTGKRFIVDPRAQAQVVLVGEALSDVNYDEFLSILGVHGFVAFDGGGYVNVVPDANARQYAVPVLAGKERRADAEIVSAVFEVKTMPATQLVPILRPLVPQFGHLAAVPYNNTLIMVDTYANVKRIEALIKAMDKGAPYKIDHSAPTCVPAPPR